MANATMRWAANQAIRAPHLVQVSEIDSLRNHRNVTSQNHSRRDTMAMEPQLQLPREMGSEEEKSSFQILTLYPSIPSSIM